MIRETPIRWEKAECLNSSTDLFFPGEGELRGGYQWHNHIKKIAEKYCDRCPIQLECFDHALQTESMGIWGGYNFSYSTSRGYDSSKHAIEKHRRQLLERKKTAIKNSHIV